MSPQCVAALATRLKLAYEPMVLVSDKLNDVIRLLQTKLSYRERHEARRIGLKAIPLDCTIGTLKLIAVGLIGFQGLMLTWMSATLNGFIRPLKHNDFQEDAGRKNRVRRHGSVHDPGIEQEPSEFVDGCSESIRRSLRLYAAPLFARDAL